MGRIATDTYKPRLLVQLHFNLKIIIFNCLGHGMLKGQFIQKFKFCHNFPTLFQIHSNSDSIAVHLCISQL